MPERKNRDATPDALLVNQPPSIPETLLQQFDSKLRGLDVDNGLMNLAGFEIDEHTIEWVVRQLELVNGSTVEIPACGWSGEPATSKIFAMRMLDLERNKIGERGAQAIARSFPNLKFLCLTCNAVGDSGVAAIARSMLGLVKLDIGSNQIGETGAEAVAENLTSLISLDVAYNEIGAAGAAKVAENLPKLRDLNISRNAIGEVGMIAIAHRLQELTSLAASSNSIGPLGAIAIANKLSGLKSLHIGNNAIGDAGAVAIAKHLTSLEYLECGKNEISDVGVLAIAEHLITLTSLSLHDNVIAEAETVVTLLQKISPAATGGMLNWIDIRGNPLKWSSADCPISEETLDQHNPAKLLQLLLDSHPAVGDQLMSARATMAGIGMSGKTRLTRWLVNHQKKTQEISEHDRTVGIEPLETILNGSQFGQPALGRILLTVLDCGGQQEQLQSHYNLVYKASGRSLFIICLHAGKDFQSREGNRADYYLRMLQSYCVYADRPLPVIMVVTHGALKGIKRKLHVPEPTQLLERYPQLSISTIDPYLGHLGDGIEHVQRIIVGVLAKMPEISAMLPKGILKLRNAIQEEFQLNQPLPPNPRDLRIDRPSLSPAQFSKICSDHGITDESLHGDYLRHLANLGVVLAPGVEETVGADVKRLDSVVSEILNPRYVNRFVYGLLMNNRVREQQGFVSETDFKYETPSLTKAERNALWALLKKYLVAFEWKHGDQEGVLIPDLLPERQMPARWGHQLCGATLFFRNVFLGEPRFFEFLSTYKRLIKPLDLNDAERRMSIYPIGVFRNEVCIYDEPFESLVQIDVIEGRIDIALRGGTVEESVRFREQLIGALDNVRFRQSRSEPRVEVERWQSGPTTSLRPKTVGKGKYDLAELQLRIEKFVETHGFPWPQRMLANYFRCPENSLSVIVNRSETLKAARDLQKLLCATGGRKHQQIEGAILDGSRNLKASDPEREAALRDQYELLREFDPEQILSELCSDLPAGKKREDARRLAQHQTTEFLRRTLALHRVNSCET